MKPKIDKTSLSGKTKILNKPKLTIDVPNDNYDVPATEFNKNSPTAKRVSTTIRKTSASIFAPKHKSPVSKKHFKKYPTAQPSPKPEPKVFKFPSTPKFSKKGLKSSSVSRPSKTKSTVPKIPTTPNSKKAVEGTKKRPKTCSGKIPEIEASSSIKSLITQLKSPAPDPENADKNEVLYKEHLFQTFQAMKFVKSLKPANLEQLKEKRITVPWRKGYEGKKTIVFDLDETLVHCCEDISTSKPDVILPVTFPTGEIVQAGINIRPFALDCLREISKEFEVFVFTASHPCYANVVLDYLDPKKEMIHQRYFRDSCISVNGVYIKDLRIFANRNLKDIVIVDNAAYSFAYQLDNGIPIVSWHDDPTDKELFNLMDYVKALAAVDDVRDLNEQTFHMRTFYEDYLNEYLVNDETDSKNRIIS